MVEVPDVPFTLPGGEVRSALVRLVPLRDTHGAVIGVIGTAVSGDTTASGGKRR